MEGDEDEEDDEEEEEEEKEEIPVLKKIKKNPDVDTSFLPDREREDEENRLREELRQVEIKLNQFQGVLTLSIFDSCFYYTLLKMETMYFSCLAMAINQLKILHISLACNH